MASRGSSENGTAVDTDALREVLADHPVRLAVLFGSAVRGDQHPHSDVDLAVEFDGTVDDPPTDAVLSLLADLSSALERNDVDLSVVTDLKPRVGLVAFTEGVPLVGSADRVAHWRSQFEREVAADDEDRSLRERFDAVIDAADEIVTGSSR
jgi:predicted nucleotidyltransferase